MNSDATLTRRVTLTIAVATAASVTVIVAAVVLVALALTVREQRADAVRIARDAAMGAEDVNDPPAGVVLLRSGGETSPNAPPELIALDIDTIPAGTSEVHLGHDRSYELYTSDRDGVRTVAAVNLDYRERELDRLLGGLLPAGLLGVVGATIVGWLLARRAVRPLADALALQRRFVADASHELRTPLTILHTRAQLLRRRAEPYPDLHAGVDGVLDDTRALTDIINDLLLSAELPHRQAQFEDVDVAALAEAVVASFAPSAQRAGVELTLSSQPPTVVLGARVALRRAIAALVDNALGHTAEGGHIRVTVAARDAVLAVEVADDGSGLDPAEAAHLVQRFARSAEAPGGGRRFGLGLALVQEIAQAHHGGLTLEGAPGQGARVTITLPLPT